MYSEIEQEALTLQNQWRQQEDQGPLTLEDEQPISLVPLTDEQIARILANARYAWNFDLATEALDGIPWLIGHLLYLRREGVSSARAAG